MFCNGYSTCGFNRKFYLAAFFILLRNITTIGYQVNTHQIVKRMELELCLDQFDIHRDTIIRTEESLSIGGKYIQGLNIETLEQCQHLCCETDGCDVFIFEGKNGGYCYLFECGPPENFRCKFTRHANYTSAVLTPIRRITTPTTTKPPPPPSVVASPPLHSQPHPQSSLSQHELELTNLKQKPDNIPSNENRSAKSTSTVPPAGASVIQSVTTPKNIQSSSSACRRFQFQCHSGECIAVYNACDGIPQCEDGSDEGPECPAGSPVVGKPSTGEKPEEIPNITLEQNTRTLTGNAMSSAVKQVDPQTAPRLYPQSPNINNREDPMSAPSAWSNRKLQEPQDTEHNSRIFNHKGGLQIATNNVGQPYQNPIPNLYNSIQRDMYMQPDYQLPYRSPIIQPQDHMIPPQNINWQQPQLSQPLLTVGGPYISAVNGQPVPQVKAPVVQQTPPVNTPLPSGEQKDQTQQNTQANSAGTHSSGSKDKDKEVEHNIENSNESEENEEYEEKSTEPPKKKQHRHRKPTEKEHKQKSRQNKTKTEKPIDTPLHEQLKMIRDDMEMEFIDHDGKSERPGGAVLSLTLGIIVTAALAVLVGCRMRTVSRRSRRSGKAPYAHDADFLVNGMYL